MTDLIVTSDAAALLKTALHAAFPGIRFSVRKDRGTACAWLRVSYTDGPTTALVQEIADRYTAQRFNPMTDSYDQMPDRLVQFDGEQAPRVVRYLVDGVIVTREMGAAGRTRVAAHVAAIAPGVVALAPDGTLTAEALTPEQAAALGGAQWALGPATVRDIARTVFSRLDVPTA